MTRHDEGIQEAQAEAGAEHPLDARLRDIADRLASGGNVSGAEVGALLEPERPGQVRPAVWVSLGILMFVAGMVLFLWPYPEGFVSLLRLVGIAMGALGGRVAARTWRREQLRRAGLIR